MLLLLLLLLLSFAGLTKCLTKSNGSPQCICPAVTGSVTATPSHVHLCQKEKLIWHGAPRGWLYSGVSPIHCHSLMLVDQVTGMSITWRQLRMIGHESKQAISVAVTVGIAKGFPIGLESKNLSIYSSNIRGKNP